MNSLKALVLSMILVCCTSCSSDDGPNTIEFETLALSDQSPVSPGRSQHIINNEAEYEALFGTSTNADFDRETIIAVFLGQVGNDGNTFEISEIIDNVSNITVNIIWRVPRIATGANTNHYHVVKTDKISRTVNFSTTEIRE